MDPAPTVDVLGWHPTSPDETGPTIRLDWRRFSYAGKFVMSNTGKAVLREGRSENGEVDQSIIAAVAFNEDRTDPTTLWLRYITVREDRRGEGLGPVLCETVAERAEARGYGRVRIAVNNPFAYEALYKAGFGFTGRETGLAELVLERPSPSSVDRTRRYCEGLDRFRDRASSEAERRFLSGRRKPPRG
jgi:GNAT superfamily N-acetyltransferase